MKDKRFSHIKLMPHVGNKPVKFFHRMNEDDEVTSAVIGVHYDPRQFVRFREINGIKSQTFYRKVKVITLWLRPHLFVFNLRK